MHTVIVGNGILALTTAFRLLQRGGAQEKITIIGPPLRSGSATLAAAAMLNSFAEVEVGALDSELDLFRFELSHLASRMWPKFEREIIDAAGSTLPAGCSKCEGCSGGGCFDTGTYIVNNAAADDLDDENFDAIVKALEDFNEPFAHVLPRDIPNYMPEQRYRATRAIYLHDEGWFNPRLMMEKLEALLRHSTQVVFVDQSVRRLLRSGNEILAAELDDGQQIAGDKFLLANGASATDLLAQSDIDLGIQRVFYGVGVSIEVRSRDFPHTKCVRTPNRGLACGLYTVPYFVGPDVPHDHILIGASNLISPDPIHFGRVGSVESLLKGAMEQINTNFYRAELVRVNVGWRPTSQDTYPLLGKTSLNNLIVATGTKRDGFHLSPLLSQILSSLLNDESVDPRLSWFSPERKPLRPMSREEAISKAVRHLMSAAYQHGFTPAKSRMPDQMRQMYREDLERLHDQIGAADWGIPTEMLDMYRYGQAKT